MRSVNAWKVGNRSRSASYRYNGGNDVYVHGSMNELAQPDVLNMCTSFIYVCVNVSVLTCMQCLTHLFLCRSNTSESRRS